MKADDKITAKTSKGQTKRTKNMGCTFEEWSQEGTERAGAMGEELLRETRLTLD